MILNNEMLGNSQAWRKEEGDANDLCYDPVSLKSK